MSAAPKKRREARRAAVALQFERGRTPAPRITAKGQGQVAEKMIAVARDHGVPIVEDALLVEALAPFDVGREIPPELYHVVAEILVTVYKTEEDRSGRGGKIPAGK